LHGNQFGTEVLLKTGANPNLQDKDGQTLLHLERNGFGYGYGIDPNI
jgi:hypothetical protein